MNMPLPNPIPELSKSEFPADFMWGCSTSSFQIEGAASEAGRVPSIWDHFAEQVGRIRDGSDARVACDHYHRWQEDLDIAQQMGLNAYRFSISWPRVIIDATGTINEEGLQFYSDLVDGMLARGLQPWATLYHWDLPQYLQEQGGWENRATVYAYLNFADVVSRRLGDRIKNWITHNEPWCTAMHGNWDGMHAPGKRDFRIALQVCHHVLLSHGLAVPLLRQNVPDAKVGIALSLHPLRPATTAAKDVEATRRHDGLRNRWFLDPLHGRGYPQDIWELAGAAAPQVQRGDLEAIAAPLDFLGVNYYFPEVIQDAPSNPPLATSVVHDPDCERTAFGWEVAPQGMASLLHRIQRDYQPAPMYLTENGCTYDDVLEADGSIRDTKRRDYFIRHLAVLREVIREGIDVRGYFAWSLIDNFEWAEGYVRRFGLVYIDFQTQQRTLKMSGHWYRDFLRG
jgi:beta-glucosidase